MKARDITTASSTAPIPADKPMPTDSKMTKRHPSSERILEADRAGDARGRKGERQRILPDHDDAGDHQRKDDVVLISD